MYMETFGCMYGYFGCMSMERLGACMRLLGAKYAETLGCMYADFGCKSMERLDACLTVFACLLGIQYVLFVVMSCFY